MKPLSGVKILDFSQIHGAVFATMLLSDFGADVIKIEKTDGGERLRQLGPKKDGYSLYHAYLNRGKRSIALDLTTEEGKDIVKELVKDADAVVENFRYGVMDELGLGFEDLKKVNPKIVYASLSGYGRDGSKKDKASFDNTMQAFSGMLDMTGYADSNPISMGAQWGNLYGGMNLALGVLLALINVKKGGEGQIVDVSGSDSLFSVLEDGVLDIEFNGRKHYRNGSTSEAITPYDTFQTSDGYVSIGATTAMQWEKFCNVLGMEDAIDDPRFNTNKLRCQNYYTEGLRERIESITSKMSKFELEEKMGEQNIPTGSVCTVKEVIENEQVKHREMIITVPDPVVGEVTMPGVVPKLSGTPASVDKGAPTLGEDTDSILESIGMDKEKIDSLKDKGIVK